MSSDGIQRSENGCSSAESLKSKTTLKSLVIPDHDPLKIKLKISKRDIEDEDCDPDNDKDSSTEFKTIKSQRNVSVGKVEGKNLKECSKEEMVISEEKVRVMKLRSKKESDDGESAADDRGDAIDDKKKRRENLADKEYEKPKKRGKMSRYIGDDNAEKIEETTRSRRSKRNEDSGISEKFVETLDEPKEVNKESFCWTCHKDGSVVKCDTCPRVFHLKCVSLSKDPSKDWICPECSLVLHAEKMSTRSEAMKSLSLDQLCTLLNFAIGRMKNVPESQAFWKPVDPKEVPFYDKYITNPMDLNLLEKNMKAKMYGSPQAFLADTKWLLHNSIIFNSTHSPLTSTARFLVKICRQEMAEIENCPDCYLNAHTKEKWFIEVCRKPHILIWARLKGFPFWPAKAMSTNLKTQQVDARFFGAHDKAWVPVKECFLYSKNSPQLFSKKRADLDDAFLEAEGYIKKIRQKYGSFCYAPDKTPFVPEMYDTQLQFLIPNYKEEKPLKKKRKSEQIIDENGLNGEKDSGKKQLDTGMPHRFKLKRPLTDVESSKVDGDDCMINDEYVSEEKVANEGLVSPEDEIARRLEMYDTHKKLEGDAGDENSTDLDEDASVRIPEHGYSRRVENPDQTESPVESSPEEQETFDSIEKTVLEGSKESTINNNDTPVKNEPKKDVVKEAENECIAESSDSSVSSKKNSTDEITNSLKTNSEQCEVSSTSADLKVIEREDQDDVCDPMELDSSTAESTRQEKNQVESCDAVPVQNLTTEKLSVAETPKKDDDRTTKSFVNLSCDQKQKIINEAKLLANIDEMTALGKQKVLNELGLDASNVDIRQLAQENRQILEALNKTCQNQNRQTEEVSIKNEEFEQYLLEENSEENIFDEEDILAVTSPKPGSIKVRDIQSLSKNKNNFSTGKSSEPILKIMDVQSLRDLKELAANDANKSKGRKTIEEAVQSKKLKTEPVVQLIKLDAYKSMEKLNRKLRLSDEVSLLMVDGDKKVSADLDSSKTDANKEVEKVVKTYRARKSMPNRAKSSTSSDSLQKSPPKNINVISVDTENSTAQKNLLKSLRLEEKKADYGGKKTVLITTGEKGIKNVDVKNGCETTGRKQIKEVTIEAVKDPGKGTEAGREGNVMPGKNVAVVANSHLIVTNQGSQPNLALAQNNLGQLSLVHLSNLTSGIQTNFVNLTNETIGFNNSIGTLYASPGFNTEFPVSTTAGSVILTPTLTASLPASLSGSGGPVSKSSKVDPIKLPINRIGSTGKSTPGISVKSPATLGLITSQPSKLPPLIAIPGEGVPMVGDVGSVTSELNKHSIKMAEYMRATIEDILRELSNQGSLEAKYKLLSLEMEKLQWRHQQEIMELKHHSERNLMELRNSLESEKQKCLSELKAQLESQHQNVISETKRKQWCANCGKEALLYCCWNTSYCDYPCQQQHWPGHMSTCAQLGNNVSLEAPAASQLQSKAPRMRYHNSNHAPVASSGNGKNESDGSGGSHREKTYRPNRF